MRISDWSSDVCSSDLLLFDLVRGAIERTISVGAVVGALEHQPLHHMRDDVAGEAIVVRATTESDLGGDRAGEIFTCNTLETVSTLLLERVVDIDLVARTPDIHSHQIGRAHV